MVQQSIKDGRCQCAVVVKDFWPFFEHTVGSDYRRSIFVALTDNLEQQVSAGFIDRCSATIILAGRIDSSKNYTTRHRHSHPKFRCVLNEPWRITRLWLSDANVSTLSLAGGLSLHPRSSPILCRVRRERSREPLE